MNNILKYLASAVVVATGISVFTACDDWTEPEHIDINYSKIEDAENYPAYLANLRDYRATSHKKVYAWVNLTAEGPKNQSERLTSLPDSIDVLVLSTPGEIHPVVLEDMKTVRADKGMEVMYQIDFDGIKTAHTKLCEDLSKQRSDLELAYAAREDADDEAVKAELADKLAELADPTLLDYMFESLTESLGYANKMNLDGVIFAFDGKSTNHMTNAEKSAYTAQQLAFLGAARDWHQRNPSMKYDFLGLPQNVSDKEMLGEFNMMFIRQGLNATNANIYSYYLSLAAVEGVPADRLGMMATYISSDPDDATTGVFSDGTYALDGFAKWVVNADVACIGLQNVQYDYFFPSFTYPHVRAAIQAANPSIR